jgi:isopenicillin N synthase-like dioxygenase
MFSRRAAATRASPLTPNRQPLEELVSSAPAIPILDARALHSGDRAAFIKLARAIGVASRDIGFFALADHGVPAVQIDGAFAAAAAFFGSPLAAKEALAMERSAAYRGYSRLGAERLDPARPGDAKESFNIGPELPDDDPDIVAGTPFFGLNQWPPLSGFRAAMTAYYDAMNGLAIALQRAIAVDLELADEDYFVRRFDRPLATLRLLRYPPHPGAFDDTLYGAAPHTDYGVLSLLAQDDAGGLEVRTRDGTWIVVPPTPGTLICNIGDALMRWSNDVYVSTPHRVVNREQRDRYSIVFFADPNPDALIECLPSCAAADRPARYPPIDYAAYQRERYDATYAARAT